MHVIDRKELHRIFSIPVEEFEAHKPRMKYRLVADSRAMGELMSQELIDVVVENNRAGTRPQGSGFWPDFSANAE